MVSVAGFATNIVYNVAILIVFVCLFLYFVRRRENAYIYFPARLKVGKGTTISDTVIYNKGLGWLREVLSATEEDIIEVAGLDAVVYLRLFQTCLQILVASLLFGIILLPINYTADNYETEYKKNLESNTTVEYGDIDKLSMGNIEIGSSRLWSHAIGVYWVSFAVYFFLAKSYGEIMDLRARYQARSDARVDQFAVLFTDIPGKLQGKKREEQVDDFLRRLHGRNYATALPVVDIKEASKLWAKLETAKKKLARAEACFAMVQTLDEVTDVRPKHRTGFLGLVGPQIDSIEHWRNEIKELHGKLRTEQQKAMAEKRQRAAFAIFGSRPAAITASQTIHAKAAETWQAYPAPEPREVIWENLGLQYYERTVRRAVMYFATFLAIVFYMIPIGFISALSTLDNLKKTLTFLKPIFEIKAVKSLLDAFLPQLALIIFLAILPGVLFKLSKAEGITSLSHATRAASGKYFLFMVFNVFIGFSIGGSLFGQLEIVKRDPGKIVEILGQSLPMNSLFFITFIITKSFTGYGLELSRIVPLIVFNIKKKYLCKTDAEVLEAWKPAPFSYATAVPNDLLIMMLALCYSVIAPLILPFGIVYFGLGLIVNRRRALNVCVPEFESVGRMWPHISCRILGSLLTMQLTMLGFFGIKQFKGAPVIVVLPFCTAVFFLYTRVKFYKSFTSTSLEVACQNVEELPTVSMIKEAYTPECMSEEQLEWTDRHSSDGASMTGAVKAAKGTPILQVV